MKNCLFLDQPAGRGPVEHWLSAARRSHMLAWVGPLGHPPGLAHLATHLGWPNWLVGPLWWTQLPPTHPMPVLPPIVQPFDLLFFTEPPASHQKFLQPHLIGSVSSSLLHLGSLLRKPNFILTETGQASDSQFVSQR